MEPAVGPRDGLAQRRPTAMQVAPAANTTGSTASSTPGASAKHCGPGAGRSETGKLDGASLAGAARPIGRGNGGAAVVWATRG